MERSLNETEYLQLMDGIYIHVQGWFGDEFMEYPERKKRVIRRWIRREYADEIRAMTEGQAAPFSTPELLEHLVRCYRREEEQKSVLATLNPEACSLIEALLKAPQFPGIERRGTDLVILEESAGFCCRLIFENADGNAEEEQYQIDKASITREGGGYCLTFEFYREPPYSIRFSNVRVEIEVYRVEFTGEFDSPWSHLQQLGLELCHKAELPGNRLNAKERELFPVLNELANLSHRDWLEPGHRVGEFPYLRAILRGKPADLLQKLEKASVDTPAFKRRAARLLWELDHADHEKLWRQLFKMFQDSQAEYPSKVEIKCDPQALAEARQRLGALLEKNGYTGIYPNYYRSGKRRGIHLTDSYGNLRLYGPQAKVVYHIRCVEEWDAERLKFRFLCGFYVPIKKEEGDIYSCTFREGRYRNYHLISYDRGLRPRDWPAFAAVAVKRAELKPLLPAERRLFTGVSSLSTFATTFMVMGGIFGILMIPGMMGMQFFICLLSGRTGDFLSAVRQVPWVRVVLTCWVGFGTLMGLFNMIFKRK